MRVPDMPTCVGLWPAWAGGAGLHLLSLLFLLPASSFGSAARSAVQPHCVRGLQQEPVLVLLSTRARGALLVGAQVIPAFLLTGWKCFPQCLVFACVNRQQWLMRSRVASGLAET